MEDFDKILLYHPQGDMTYIRKLTMSYGYYTVLAIVDHNNKVEYIGIDNTFQIIPYHKLNESDKRLLGRQKCEKLKENDLLNIYRINKAIKLRRPYRLRRQCKNMRYTTEEETIDLKRLLIENINNQIQVENTEYENTYTDKSILNLNQITTNIRENLQEITLENYNSLQAKGQTKLM